MSIIPSRTIKSWVSRQSAPTVSEQALIARSCEKKIFYPMHTSLDFLQQEVLAAKKLYLDIGFGDGQSLLQLADFDTEALVIGIEPHLPGIIHVLRALEEKERPNVRVACCDVYSLFPLLQPRSLDRVHLYFSDPWPKKRHHKRRLIQKSLWETLKPLMSNNGIVHIATDWAPYALMIEDQLLRETDWFFSKKDFLPQELQFHRQPTKYERKAHQEGRDIAEFYIRLKDINCS